MELFSHSLSDDSHLCSQSTHSRPWCLAERWNHCLSYGNRDNCGAVHSLGFREMRHSLSCSGYNRMGLAASPPPQIEHLPRMRWTLAVWQNPGRFGQTCDTMMPKFLRCPTYKVVFFLWKLVKLGLLIFFIFGLSYTNNTRGFHCDNSMHAYMYLEQVYRSIIYSPSHGVWGVSPC